LTPQKGYRRGYAVAVLTGIEENQAVIWKVFSNVVKPEKTVHFNGARSDPKALYNFHEALVNALRPAMKEGVCSIILASPARTNYAEQFRQHIRSHHTWLMQGPSKTTLSEMIGSATTPAEVTVLTRNPKFRKIIAQTTEEENENLLELLEKRLNTSSQEPLVLYSLEEAEYHILSPWKAGKPKPDYLLLTDTYLSSSRQKNRLHRLMQVAANKQVKTQIVKADSPAGKRITQLSGIVCLQKLDY
jgi:stalled ribosome rescue protein Dom34